MICGTLLGITFGYREHQVVYYRLTALKSIAWEMYQPYSHKDQEGLQEPLNRHGGPAPAGGGVLKEKGEKTVLGKFLLVLLCHCISFLEVLGMDGLGLRAG